MKRLAKYALAYGNLTQTDIAQVLGIPRSTVSAMLSAYPERHRNKGYRHRARVAQLLQLAPETLWGQDWEQIRICRRKQRS